MALVVRRGLALLPAGALVAVAACTLTTDLDGFTGGPVDASMTSAETSLGATSDVEVPVIPVVDSGEDGASSAIEAGTCPNKPIALCEDFSTDEKKNAWQIVQTGGGTVSILETPGLAGLSAAVPKVDTGTTDAPTAFWKRPFAATVSRISFDADFQYDQRTLNPNEYHVMIAVRLDHGASWNLIYLTDHPDHNGWAIQDFPQHAGSDIDYHALDVTPNVGHHLHFDVAVGGTASFAIDGMVVSANPTPDFVVAGQPTLMIGVSLSEIPTTPLNVGFANVVFTGE